MPAVVLAVVLFALNLRTVIASLPPLLETVRADLGLSATVGGLLTTLPVVAFGALAPLAPGLARRFPLEWTLVACALVTAVAAGLRGAGGLAPLLAGSILAGVAVAVAQGILPLLIRVRHPDRTGALTGAYALALVLGATVAAAASVPLEAALGWRGALAAWAVPALAAAAVWAPRAVRAPAPDRHAARPPAGLGRSRLGWAVALFFGVQSCAFYAQLAWLPTILEADGASAETAGLLQAFGALVSAPLALAIPILAARRATQRVHLLVIVALGTAGVLGLLLAPGLPALWVGLLGLGQGGALGLGLVLPNLRGSGPDVVAAMTAHSLLIGYCVGALGPWLLGGAHDLAGGWSVPLLVLLGVTLLQLVPGMPAVDPSGSGDAHPADAQPGR